MPEKISLARIDGLTNCLEAERVIPGDSYEYERACLEMLARENPALVAIGPRLLEIILERIGYAGCQPDVMLFDPGSRRWRLEGMVEIKSGGVGGIEDKLRGMARITAKLRDCPGMLVAVMIGLIDSQTNRLPTKVFIPDDEKIAVRFVSPGVEFPKKRFRRYDFPVEHVRWSDGNKMVTKAHVE